MENIPFLGVGIGFRNAFKSDLFACSADVDFLEIIAEHYLTNDKQKLDELELLKNHFTLIPHAVGLSLGSAEGIKKDYLDKLADLIHYLNPPYWSEHICFTHAEGIEIGHLSPLEFTEESVAIFTKNVEKVRKKIQIPLVLENISYIFTTRKQMSEAEFVAKIIKNTDCGLLLDITNLYTNSFNHGFDYKEFLEEIPLEKIVQFHFTGGFLDNNSGFLIDSHSQNTPQEVWEIMNYVLSLCKPKGIILERDDNFPPFSELINELRKARNLWKNAKKPQK